MNQPYYDEPVGAAAAQPYSTHETRAQFIEDLTQRYEVLSTLNQFNEAIIESINPALVVLDNDFKIVRCNQKFLDTFSVAQGRERYIPLTQLLEDDRLETLIRQSTAAEEAMGEVEYAYRFGDEGERNFLLAISRISLPSSGDGILITFDEVTEWKRRQSQVMEASRLVSIGEMAAGIAHEINNPLAAVMGFAQLVLRREGLDPAVRKDLDKILAESRRAAKIIANLQSFARRYKPKKVSVNVIEIIKKVLDFRAYELQVANIEVKTSFAPDVPSVSGDEHQLEQVFLNLIINAEYFMFHAHGGGTLTIEAARRKDRVLLTFADDGPGIARENLAKIFDPFFTTKDVGKGTGLGLSICYGMVHEHGGTISVNSAPGQGATFTLELPVAAQTQSSDAANQQTSDATRRPLEQMNILIVDDEPSVAEFVARTLREAGCRADVADSGREVLDQRNLSAYDLIILDVRMPGVGGTTLFEHIRRGSNQPSPQVLFITGDTTNPTTREFIDSSGSPVLMKPFTMEDLMAAVRRFALRQDQAKRV